MLEKVCWTLHLCMHYCIDRLLCQKCRWHFRWISVICECQVFHRWSMVAGSMSAPSVPRDDMVVEIRSKDSAKKGRLKMFEKRGLIKANHRRSSSLPPENRVKMFFKGTMTLRGIFRNHSSGHSTAEKKPTRVYSRKGIKVSISSPILGKSHG